MSNDSSNLSSRFGRAGAFVARMFMACFDAIDEACAKGLYAVGGGLWRMLSKVPFMANLADKVHVSDDQLSDQDRRDRSRYRRSSGWAIFLHIFFIFILPWLLGLSFGEYIYGIPKGSGQETVEQVKVVKVKKIKKKFVLNPNSAFIWKVPDIDDSEVFEDVEEETAQTYAADTSRGGKLGKGGGSQGGWPNGMENAKVQFIRLKHSGKRWNQQMDADENFLNAFHTMTGLKIDPVPKVRTVSDLGKYRKGFKPPFVFITGTGEIGLSGAEKKALREFTLENTAMLFADNGGGYFDHTFRRLMREMYPEYPLVVISKDDPIFKSPYMFPEGSPKLFHHGNETLGVRGPGGRWLVFYHPGDLNDAWQTGSAGVSKSVSKRAYQLGINVVAYSFNHYMAAKAKAAAGN